jgi:AraC-like DNA-binding protein
MSMKVEVKPVEVLVYASDVVAMGTFRCTADHPLFHDSGPCTHHTFVFPRSATEIRHDDGMWFTGSPNTVSLYNQHQRYTRRAISRIDASDWFVVADDVLRDAIGDFDARPFRSAFAPIDIETYAQQRRLFNAVVAGRHDPAEVDEVALRVFACVLEAARIPVKDDSMRDAVEAAKRTIAAAPSRNVSLRALARSVDSSPFRLCRAFRRLTGMTITSFRHSLRVRLALDRLRDRSADLTELALDLGYASHSHFTAMFRRHTGVTPSQFRASV